MKILFVGASVTAQSINRNNCEITGYYVRLEQELASKFELTRLAYGSHQFHAMGVFSLSKIIELKPQVAVLEWMTTGEKTVRKDQIVSSTSLLRKHGIGVIWLVLPRLDSEAYTSKYEALNSLKDEITIMSLLDVLDSGNIDLMLRDKVHTNQLGAVHYAKLMADRLEDSIQSEFEKISQMNSRYSDGKDKYSLSHQEASLLYDEVAMERDLAVGENLELHVSRSVRIGFLSETNPRAPILSLAVDNKSPKLISIVDQWSHYSRIVLKPILSLSEESIINISIHHRLPDYNTLCPRLLEEPYSQRLPLFSNDLLWSLKSIYIQAGATITAC